MGLQFERGPEGDSFKLEELMAAGALLLGRVTYEGFAKAWPAMAGTSEFGEKMNDMPKYVVSTTLDRADWNNSTIIRGDPAEEVAKLKDRIEGDILINGSAQLVQSLVEHKLIDEYRLMLYPIVLGDGKRLFSHTGETTPLQLVDTKPVGSGVVILTYRPA